MITLKEIAERAGVSSTTVSNVLNGKINKVSPKNVQYIEGLLKEFNYIPRFGLNALTSRGSKLIGVLISTPEYVEETLYEKPFYGIIIGELENYFRSKGYYIMVYSSKDIDEIMHMALGWNIDGIISISMSKKYSEMIRKNTNKPVVSIDLNIDSEEEAVDCYNVTSPDEKAGEMMVNYLANRGCKTITYLTNSKHGADFRRYRGACAAYKNMFDTDGELPIIYMERNTIKRQQQYEQLLKHVGQDMALFFSNDLNAVEAIGFFIRKGIKIPEGFSVVGVDDDIYARLSVPSLTSTKIPVHKKATLAADMLLQIIAGQEVKKNVEVDSLKIIERESVINKPKERHHEKN